MSGMNASPVFNVNRFNFGVNDPDNLENTKLFVSPKGFDVNSYSSKHIKSKRSEK